MKILSRSFSAEILVLQGFPVRLRDSCFFRDKSGYPEIQDNQTLSIAGKRAGMAGERSGLLSEAVRIIREMRYATFGAYPKYAVWENVPGAFSSNKGEDFHAVLQSLCRVIDPNATIPRPTDARGGIK